MLEKIVIVTRKTRYEDLLQRFGTRGQAKFYIEHAGSDFQEYENEHAAYHASLDKVRRDLELGLKMHVVSREMTPTYMFTERDIVVTLGQDGLVANTAKYVGTQPIVAVNPDPQRFDGILLPISVGLARRAVEATLDGTAKLSNVTLAKVSLNDGQSLLAFNDFFIGPASHTSARYQLKFGGEEEFQSSSGIIVCTGAGSTGWMSSVFNMVRGVCSSFGDGSIVQQPLAWESENLMFVVREPFASRHSGAKIVAGLIRRDCPLVLESTMPMGGVIFSDGVERDFLHFNSGANATITLADHQARLVRIN